MSTTALVKLSEVDEIIRAKYRTVDGNGRVMVSGDAISVIESAGNLVKASGAPVGRYEALRAWFKISNPGSSGVALSKMAEEAMQEWHNTRGSTLAVAANNEFLKTHVVDRVGTQNARGDFTVRYRAMKTERLSMAKQVQIAKQRVKDAEIIKEEQAKELSALREQLKQALAMIIIPAPAEAPAS